MVYISVAGHQEEIVIIPAARLHVFA
jgi:hypothetical protein